MKNLFFAAVTICASVVFADIAYPLYTVTTSGEGTNELESAQVEVVAVADAEPETVAFSTLAKKLTTGTFRKRGTGFLMSCEGFDTFIGELRVEEGAWIATKRGHLGQSVDANTPKSSVVISNGATVVVAAPSGSSTGAMYLRQPITMSGTGYKGLGALCIMNEVTQSSCFRNTTWTLLGDTTITVNRHKTTWMYYITFYMEGHTFTISSLEGKDDSNMLGLQYVTVRNPGHIVMENAVRITIKSDEYKGKSRPSTTLGGTSDNTITYRPRGSNRYESWIQMDNFDPGMWKIILENNAVLRATHGPWGNTERAGWQGPIEVQAGHLSASGASNTSFTLSGVISGAGGIESTRGQQLNLMNAANTFTGSVSLNSYREGEGELRVFAESALPANGAGATLSDSSLELARITGTYTLPSFTFDVGAGKVETFRGGTNGFARSVTKTGVGTLDISSPIAITGITTVAGGVLRIPYAQAGLIAGSEVSVSPDYPSDKLAKINTVILTNRVALGTDLAYTDDADCWILDQTVWGGRALFTYHGYIWNRSDEPKDWSFALAISQGADLYLGGTRVSGLYATDYRASGFVRFKTVTLQPGATRFDLRIYMTNGAYGPSYAWNNYFVGSTFTNMVNQKLAWKPDFGFGINMHGEESTNVLDYVKALDPGDGSLLTVSANGLDDGVSAKMPQFSHLKISGGAFDVRGNDFTVPVLEGVDGAVTNSNVYFPGGSLTIGERWLLKGADAALSAGKSLETHVKLKFAHGAALDWDDLPSLPRGEYVLVRATGGIDGMPVWAPADANLTRWHLVKGADGDGNETLTFTWQAGSAVIFR